MFSLRPDESREKWNDEDEVEPYPNPSLDDLLQ